MSKTIILTILVPFLDMIDMDSKPMVGGVYAGPTVTVTYSKETDDVDFSEANQTVTSENHSNAHIDKTQSEPSADPSNETSMSNGGGQVELVLSVDAATNHVDIKRTVTTETLEDTTDGGKEDDIESNEIKHTKAPLASEEDLTAPDVSVTNNKQSLLN